MQEPLLLPQSRGRPGSRQAEPQAPLGWYDADNGEIGDICNADQAKVGSYTVQRVWSNSRAKCVSTANDPGTSYIPQTADNNTGGSIAARP